MATHSASDLNAQYRTIDVPIELINEPVIPERETMEEADLAELAMNIGEIGLIKPLVLKQVGDRFEVIAGHRRFLACRIANYTPIPSRIQTEGLVDPLAILIAENAHVEAVNPVEEARFYDRVLRELCENDVDMLCLKVRRRREYVEDRLNILRGDPRVTAALQGKQISLAVARELNKVMDPHRQLLLLDVAVTQGATARQVATWRRDVDGLPPLLPMEGTDGLHPANVQALPAAFKPECLFCEDSEDQHLMEVFFMHKPCKRIVSKMLGRVTEAPEVRPT